MVQLNTALRYLKHGWAVIPVHTIVRGSLCTCGNEDCPTPGKHPRVKWAEYCNRLPTEAEVRSWYTEEFPGSNIGVVTGAVSNLLVVDCDGREGVKSAKNHLELPFPTLVSLTGGGGFHVFYQTDGVKVASRPGLYEKVDIKAEHGFVVLPPSIHMSGYNYRWFRKHPISKIDLSQFELETAMSNNHHGWYAELLDGVVEGERGNVATKLAGRYIAMGADLTFVWYGMREWNRHNKPPLPESELRTTVKFVWNKHMTEAKPKEINSMKELSNIINKAIKSKEA